MVFYLGADVIPPLIPWNESSPGFHVTTVGDAESIVAKHFSKQHIRYIGSREGCGCGFRSGEYWSFEDAWEDSDEVSEYQRDHDALYEYVKSLVNPEAAVELFGCWSGDEKEPVQQRFEIAVNDLSRRDFVFLERGLFTVTA